jgi:hypothetical protein
VRRGSHEAAGRARTQGVGSVASMRIAGTGKCLSRPALICGASTNCGTQAPACLEWRRGLRQTASSAHTSAASPFTPQYPSQLGVRRACLRALPAGCAEARAMLGEGCHELKQRSATLSLSRSLVLSQLSLAATAAAHPTDGCERARGAGAGWCVAVAPRTNLEALEGLHLLGQVHGCLCRVHPTHRPRQLSACEGAVTPRSCSLTGWSLSVSI